MADQQLIDDNESIDSKEDELFGRNDLSIDSDSNDDGFPTLAKIGCSLKDYDIIFKKSTHQILFGRMQKHLMSLMFLQQLMELDKIHGIKLFRR